MKLLVIGAGMMGSAAAFDMARNAQVDSVTLADSDAKRAREVAARVNRITGGEESSSRRVGCKQRKSGCEGDARS